MKQIVISTILTLFSVGALAGNSSIQLGDYVTELFGRNSGPHKVVEISTSNRYRLSDGSWYRIGNLKKHEQVESFGNFEKNDVVQVTFEQNHGTVSKETFIDAITADGLIFSDDKWFKASEISIPAWYQEIKANLKTTMCGDIPKLNRTIDKRLSIVKVKFVSAIQKSTAEGHDETQLNDLIAPLIKRQQELESQLKFVQANSSKYCVREGSIDTKVLDSDA